MSTGTYTIRGGTVGRERLRVLSSVMAPNTAALLDRVGIACDATCIDVGCGGGDVTAMLAARATDGRVIGTDADEVKVGLAPADLPANVELVVEDVATTVGRRPFADVVYARFLLSHLGDGRRWVDALAGLLLPGGLLVLEDTHSPARGVRPDRRRSTAPSTSTAGRCGPTVGIPTSGHSCRRTSLQPGSSTSASTWSNRRHSPATASASNASRSTPCATRRWLRAPPMTPRSTTCCSSSTS